MPVEEEDALKIYLEQIAKVPLLTKAEEVELAGRISKGNEEARQQMITANLRLVVKIAQDYSGSDYVIKTKYTRATMVS